LVAFTVYAVLVGFLAARWRRRMLGVALVIAAEIVLLVLAWAHYQIPVLAAHGHTAFANIDIQPFQLFFYPYIVLVGVIGAFIVAMPRKAPADSCWYCRYDLTNLIDEPGPLICPECGREHLGPGSRRYRRSGEVRADLSRGDVAGPRGAGEGDGR
jgi:hypothetical protein